jgi:methyl-accepting chemotaxis protein
MSIFPFKKNAAPKTEQPASNPETQRKSSGNAPKEQMLSIPFSTVEIISRVCEHTAAGNLEDRVVGLPEHDPLRSMADSLNATLDRIDAFVRESAAMMEHCSRDRFHRPLLLQGLGGAFRSSAATINKAGMKMEQSFQQFEEISRLAEDNAQSIGTVASACEELNATTSEISRQAGLSSAHTQKNSQQVATANTCLRDMSESVQRIGDIVTLIESIAAQTNLLALNAMIEASRAGQQGSRFAVVAGEVKELARNTSNATERIAEQVMRMREVTERTEKAFQGIHSTINELNDSARLIQRTVEEQVTATEEVAHNIGGLANNTAIVSERIHNLHALSN